MLTNEVIETLLDHAEKEGSTRELLMWTLNNLDNVGFIVQDLNENYNKIQRDKFKRTEHDIAMLCSIRDEKKIQLHESDNDLTKIHIADEITALDKAINPHGPIYDILYSDDDCQHKLDEIEDFILIDRKNKS